MVWRNSISIMDSKILRFWEKIACDFYNEHGLNAPRCTFSKVYLNGIYWGLYNFIEEADTKQYLNAHFSYHDGNMFKGDPNGDLRYISNQASSYYPKYELHTNETINDWSDLVELITKINNSGGAFQDSIESIIKYGDIHWTMVCTEFICESGFLSWEWT